MDEKKPCKPCKKKMLIGLGAVCAILLIALLVVTVIIPAVKYGQAVSMMNNGQYTQAYAAFLAMGDYKDSPQKAEEARFAYCADSIKKAMVGDQIILGRYEQDNDPATTSEDVTWIVLATEGDRILVISEFALDAKQFQPVAENGLYSEPVTWETSSVRAWMNDTLKNDLFCAEELDLILLSDVTDTPNPLYGTTPGNATQDHLFLLSLAEVEQYFDSNVDRRCTPTAYAIQKGASSSHDYCWWWLRSPGYEQVNAALVDRRGNIIYNGTYTFYGNNGIRPAMWIDLTKLP